LGWEQRDGRSDGGADEGGRFMASVYPRRTVPASRGWPVMTARAVATACRSALMYVVVAGPVLSV
jgi:hypothetical protein